VGSVGSTTGSETGPSRDPTGGLVTAAESSSDPVTSVGFVPGPDHSSVPSCDLWDQDCPRGEKCTIWSDNGGNAWNATRCVPVARDPSLPGEACTAIESGVSGFDDCALGSMCWNLDEELMGTCVAFCMGSAGNPTCADECTFCSIHARGTVILCLPECDPLMSSCADGFGCYPEQDAFTCTWDVSGGAGGPGDPCEYPNACDPGLSCIDADAVPDCNGSQGCCAPYCDVALPDTCDAILPGTSCTAWFSDPRQAAEACATSTLGVCRLPG
jgi:hypothetical protein